MYKNLKTHYWRSGMKGDVRHFVAQCLSVLTSQGGEPTSGGQIVKSIYIRLEVGEHHHRLHRGFAQSKVGHDAIWVIVD